jgi:exonuclease VII large subunit
MGSLRLSRQRLAAMRSAWRRLDPQRQVERESQNLWGLWKRLQSVSPQATLRRGFTLVRNDSGKTIMRESEMKAGGRYEIEFSDGRRKVRPE